MRAIFVLLFISLPAVADTYSELTRDGSRAQALLDSVARKAVSQPIQGMDVICPNYKAFNNDRTKRSLIWSEILSLANSPIETSLSSVDAGMSVKPLVALASAKNVARVTAYCRGLPTPNGTPSSTLPPMIQVADCSYSSCRVYKAFDKANGDLAMWPQGETGSTLGKGFGMR